MVKAHVWNGEAKLEKEFGTVVKAREWAGENLGDNPKAFGYLLSNKTPYTVVRQDGKTVMTSDACGRDAWAALDKSQEATMADNPTTPAVNPIKESLDGLKVIEFTYTDRLGNVTVRQAIVLDDKLSYAARDDKGRQIVNTDMQPVMRQALNTVMSLRPDDRGYRDGHTWDYRHPYVDMMQDIKVLGVVTVDHPAIRLIKAVKPAAAKLEKMLGQHNQ